MRPPRAWIAGRLARLGAPRDFHHGLLWLLPGPVLEQVQAALAGADEVDVAVSVDVHRWNLHAAADLAPVGDHVADPFRPTLGIRPELIPVEAERLLFAGILAVVRHEALAGDEVGAAVRIEIDQRRGVRL